MRANECLNLPLEVFKFGFRAKHDVLIDADLLRDVDFLAQLHRIDVFSRVQQITRGIERFYSRPSAFARICRRFDVCGIELNRIHEFRRDIVLA